MYIEHPLITPNKIELREYQKNIAEASKSKSTLVVLPTGRGKSAVAVLVMAHRLQYGKALMLAPTKPLVAQHETYYRSTLTLPKDQINMLTGTISVKKRREIWNTSKVILATPQTIENDIKNGVYDLSGISLLIIDECHRGIGNYAYTTVAEQYIADKPNGVILAMTASPGSDKSKIDEIKRHFDIEHVESRTDTDPDVVPYVHATDMEYIRYDLPDDLRRISDLFKQILEDRFTLLKNMGFSLPNTTSPPMKVLNDLKKTIDCMICSDGDSQTIGYAAVSLHAEILKVRHGIGLAECQGSVALQRYLYKLKGGSSKADIRLCSSPEFIEIFDIAKDWKDEQHPKVINLPLLVMDELEKDPDSRILIFASYRDTVSNIVHELKEAGISVSRFVGQARSSDDGLSQKKQIETVEKFRDGEYQVLVATSVAEEGIDIPNCNVIIFYEPVPSGIRTIQRRGRTSRFSDGRVITLIANNTIDEVYLQVAKKKEESMKTQISDMRKKKPISILDF